MYSVHKRFLLLATFLGGLALLAGGCGAGGSGEGSNGGGSGGAYGGQVISEKFNLGGPQDTARLAVGSKNFTEQQILGEITVQALEEAGAEVAADRTGLGGTEAVRQALVTGDIDLYWEYTGTGWLIHLAQPDPIQNAQEQYEAVAEQDLSENNIKWLPPAPANNTYVLAASGETAEDLGVQTISDLQQLVEQRPEEATLCAGPEFSDRADGLPGLEEHYGFEFPDANVFVLPEGTVYEAVARGEKCNFGSVFKTNGRVTDFDLTLLEDDENFFAHYNPSLTMRQETLERYPQLAELFAPISEKLDTETLRELSSAAQSEDSSIETIAERWLRENGFIE